MGQDLGHQIIQGFWSGEQKELHINCLELEAVILTIKKTPFSVEKSMCSGPFRQHSSNSAVLQNLGSLAVDYKKQYILESSSHSGSIKHPTQSVEQSSDTAHRVDLERYSVEANFSDLGVPRIDLFASYLNKKLAIFCAWDHHPLAFAVDAFSVTWNQMFAYAFQPICLVPKVLEHMI